MAIFKSASMTSASGSVGGMTYSHNRSGMYMRARRIPVNPSSVPQQEIRALFSDASSAFKSLTPAEQLAWKDYAAGTPRVNALGDTIILTAQQMFVAVNTLGTQLGFPTFTGPPPSPGIANLGPDLVVAVTEGTPDTLDVTGIATSLFRKVGAKIGVYVGVPQSNGRAFYKGPYTLNSTQTGATGTATSLTIPLTGVIAEGGTVQIPIRLAGIDGDGRISTVLAQLLPIDTP